jgi:Ca2+/Na+ antiporter
LLGQNHHDDDSSDDEGNNERSFVWVIVPHFHLKREKDVKKHWPIILIAAIFTISVLANFCMDLTKELASEIGLKSTRMLGTVLTAIGAQIDDIFASIALS